MRNLPLFLVSLCFTALPAGAEGKTWAVIVGVDDYPKANLPALRYCVADAKLFSQALQDIVHVPRENIILLTSDSPDAKAQARLNNVAYMLGWLREKVGKEDTVILYFSGHGCTMDGQSYLLTQEADNRNAAALKFSALRCSDVTDLLKAYSARRALLIVDTGRGKGGKPLDSSLQSSVTLPSGSGSEQSGTLLSCRVGEQSWDWEAKHHGFFTYYLVQGLRQHAADAEGRVSLGSLGQYLAAEVPRQTSAVVQAEQNPVLNYIGSSPQSWQLATVFRYSTAGDDSRVIAQLEATRARLDVEVARRAAAEQRANLEESRRRELECRLSILEKQAGKVPPRSNPALPQAAAYDKEANDRKATEEEVRRLRAENDALKARITTLSQGVNSREVTLGAKVLEKNWQVGRSGSGSLAGEQELRQALGAQLDVLVKACGQTLQTHYAQTLAGRPPAEQKAAAAEIGFLTEQLEAQKQASQSAVMGAESAERARASADQRLAEAEARVANSELLIKGLTVKLKESERKLAEMQSQVAEAEKAAREARERATAAWDKLAAQEDALEAKNSSLARNWIRVTRKVKFSDMSGNVEVHGPEATELPPPK